jgi:hypothetical protein
MVAPSIAHNKEFGMKKTLGRVIATAVVAAVVSGGPAVTAAQAAPPNVGQPGPCRIKILWWLCS